VVRDNVIKSQANNIVADIQKTFPLWYLAAEAVIIHIKDDFYLGFFVCWLVTGITQKDMGEFL